VEGSLRLTIESSRARRTLPCVTGDGMQFRLAKAAVLDAVRRSVGVISGLVVPKRCWRCRHLMSKQTIHCAHCGKWQG
jgi:hypothetical protein